MIPQWIIEKKRDGLALDPGELKFFIEGYTRDTIPDYQMAAMAMAIYFQGMTLDETATLTELMMNSGDLVDTSSIDLPKVDKHSTGGVGDKVSLLLAPLVACCGAAVPMISGRGLGITGGTLDKMEAIPGYRVGLSDREFIAVLQQCGCSMIGQTGQLAPADKKLYALRDVTATVPSIPLITASIMSKKLAEGIDGLVMDVKWGRGAFMKTYEDAQTLARTIVEVGTRMNKGMAALITDMNQPLGLTAGNSVEVIEAVAALKGEGAEDLMTVTLTLCAHMLRLVGVVDSQEAGLALLQRQIDSGAAFARFLKMVELHGGNPRALEDVGLLPTARMQEVYASPQSGYLTQVSAEQIGRAVVLLGGGRSKTDDAVDHAVGITDIVKIGQQVMSGDRLLTIHANDAAKLAEARKLLDQAFVFADEPPVCEPLIKEIILPEVGV
jgi:pyrimidine-nucleoside phosphorylase